MGRYRHLSFEEREQIAIWRLQEVSQAEMARRLGQLIEGIKFRDGEAVQDAEDQAAS